jgi:hypothetical protein
MFNGRAPQKEVPKGILLTPFHSSQNIASLWQAQDKANPNFLKPVFFLFNNIGIRTLIAIRPQTPGGIDLLYNSISLLSSLSN